MREIAVSAPGFFCAMKMSETSTKLELQNRAEGDRLAGYHTAPRNKVRAENSHDLGRDSLFLIGCHPPALVVGVSLCRDLCFIAAYLHTKIRHKT